jgi:uncharacterized coiled-coil DUF342 family protein
MSNFKAGYQQAIDDLCERYDKVHRKYQELWKSGDAISDAGHRLERELVALNAAICELEVHKRAIVC